jgi:Protein of unknown function (DUF3592)
MDPSWRGESADPSAAHSPIVPSPPRTPSRRARRLVFRYQAGQLAMLIVGGGLLAFGAIFLSAFAWGVQADVLLLFSHQNVVGHVISTHVNRNVRINGVHPTEIRFRYPAADGDRVGVSSTRDEDRIAAAIVGAEIPVEVYAPHPSWARVAGTDYSTMGLWGLLFGILPAIALTLLYFAVRTHRRRIRVFTYGRPMQARVTFSDWDRSTRINGRNPYLLRWEFKTEGDVFTGSISTLDSDLVEDLKKQEEITVLYDPMNPAINTVFIP